MHPSQNPTGNSTRREFLKTVAVAAAVAMTGPGEGQSRAQTQPASQSSPAAPWYRRTLRWGQTNITEADAANYDITWWQDHWKRTEVQGVIINAGGIYAYYPSKFPLHYRPPLLKDRDLFGELSRAAREQGLTVLARMDSSKGHQDLYRAHPDWFAVDGNGRPMLSGEFYLTCINSPYYDEYLPGILREIIERSRPDGVTDNSWSGVDRNNICQCANCATRFEKYCGKKLPTTRDWNETAYRQWIEWSYSRRLEQWDFNNKVTREAGGADCLWLGMNGASVLGQSASFRDMKEICARSEIIILDNQTRSDAGGFGENALDGKLIHGLLGWDKLIPESMAMYQAGSPQFRFSSKPAAEARMWMLAGFAGGIQPWWHHVGANCEDRRMYQTAEPVMQWHSRNEEFLINRRPVATVAVGWSQRNADFFGRDDGEARIVQPWRGFTQALVRARIPFVPVHLDHLQRDAAGISVIVLPNIGAMEDSQVDAIRRFVAGGGSLIATGQTSLFDRWGDPRSDFALAELFGVSGRKPAEERAPTQRGATTAAPAIHTYLRLPPPAAAIDGPNPEHESPAAAPRHPVLAGFDETQLIAYGGSLQPLTLSAGASALLTYVPPFPATPPEDVWMRTPKTDIPGLVVNEVAGGGRVVFIPADIDRRYALYNLPDHANLLANAVRWAAGDTMPLAVAGPGLLNFELYEQGTRLILHIVNLTSAGTWRAPVEELIHVGPIRVRIRKANAKSAKAMVSDQDVVLTNDGDGWMAFELNSILDHEMIVVEA
jgi:hypothetical protein